MSTNNSMTVNEMYNNGMISREEAQALADNRAKESYNSSSSNRGGEGSEFYGMENNITNLKSALANIISNISNAPSGMFPSEAVQRANEYKVIHKAGGLENVQMSRADINHLLTEAQSAVEHAPDYLGNDWSIVESVAAPIQANESDEDTQARAAEAAEASRSTDKIYSEDDNIVVSQTTGSKFIRQEDGTLTPYLDRGSDEYLESVAADSDEQFMASGGEGSNEDSMFAGLEDR